MEQRYRLRTTEQLFDALEALYTRIRKEDALIAKSQVVVQIVNCARDLIQDSQLERVNKEITELEREVYA